MGKLKTSCGSRKLTMIPENDFQFIGSGGYGKVYKIKLDNESCELAVKIVADLWQTGTDYSHQIRAWRKNTKLFRASTPPTNHSIFCFCSR